MKTLFLKKEFIPHVISGKKTQTIRTKTILKKDDSFTINFKNPICKVIAIKQKLLKDITESEARLDGFESKPALVKKLKEIYSPSQIKKSFLFLIKFKVISS